MGVELIRHSSTTITLHFKVESAPADTRSGYKVGFVPFSGGMPSGETQAVLTDFLADDGNARGRPVDAHGALLVVDDVGTAVWRMLPDGR